MALTAPKSLGELAATADGCIHKTADKVTGNTSVEEWTPDAQKVAFYQEVFRELLGDYERMIHRELQWQKENKPTAKKPSQPNEAALTSAHKPGESVSQVSQQMLKMNSNKRRIVQDFSQNDYYSNADGILRTSCTRIIEHPHFEKLVGFIIATNFMFIGVSANYAIENIENPNMEGSITMEFAFCTLYVLELGMRLVVFRFDFFTNDDRSWNLFDSCLVLQSIYEQVVNLLPAVQEGSAGNLSFLRTMRLAKVLKVMRVIRVMRSMFELRLIMTSILGSLKSMVWSLILITVVLCMFSMLFVQGVASVLSDDPKISEDDVNTLLDYWGGVVLGMRTLYAASTGGTDWLDVAYPLLQVGWVFFAIFCFYIAFFIFVILNTITALFVEATISSSMKDHQTLIQKEMEKKQEYVDKLQVLFDSADVDGDGLVSMHEFEQRMNDKRMQAFASSLGIEIADTAHFFALLSGQGHECLDLDAFVTGCIRMKGPALSVDLQEMRHNIRKLCDMLDENTRSTRFLQDRHASRSNDLHEMRLAISNILERVDMLTCGSRNGASLSQLANQALVYQM